MLQKHASKALNQATRATDLVPPEPELTRFKKEEYDRLRAQCKRPPGIRVCMPLRSIALAAIMRVRGKSE